MELLLYILLYFNVIFYIVVSQMINQAQGLNYEVAFAKAKHNNHGGHVHTDLKLHRPQVPPKPKNMCQRKYMCDGKIFDTIDEAEQYFKIIRNNNHKKHCHQLIYNPKYPKQPYNPYYHHRNNHCDNWNEIYNIHHNINNIYVKPHRRHHLRHLFPPDHPKMIARAKHHFRRRFRRNWRKPAHQSSDKSEPKINNVIHPSLKEPFVTRYEGFDISRYLSKSSFSNKIYRTLWFDCDYTCFHKYQYKFYKDRFLSNINLIREYHKVGALIESPEMSKLAQKHANKMALKEKLFKDTSFEYGEIVWASYYPAASLIVTQWYDERFNYKFGSNHPGHGTQSLTQMLWKGSKYIGIGIKKYGDKLYVDCKFYPRGNIDYEYKKNVLKRKSKWFSWFRGK
uniref:CAP domain-containing protein (inferred by orthology to a zebrafish protein) n=1 Tax=Strongyloides venezuelensis TaxID=75913 RepID=A0A0K0G1Z8_STRVS